MSVDEEAANPRQRGPSGWSHRDRMRSSGWRRPTAGSSSVRLGEPKSLRRTTEPFRRAALCRRGGGAATAGGGDQVPRWMARWRRRSGRWASTTWWGCRAARHNLPSGAGDILLRASPGDGPGPVIARLTTALLHAAGVFPPGVEAEGQGEGWYAEALDRTPTGWADAPSYRLVVDDSGFVRPGQILLRRIDGADA
jgi:hypothetical protein